MGKWNHRSRYHRRRSPERWYSECHSSSSGYGNDDGIPVWEKRFCEKIGSVPWQKVVESAVFKSWYSGNVITWNDSACEETFHNEKKRFWSQVNGLHCDISLPDPNLYISEVDWDTVVDPELIRDLEMAYCAPPDEVETGLKRGWRDNDWSDCEPVPVETIPLKGSDKVHDDINALGKKSNVWNLSESGTDHPIDWASTWRAKPSGMNEKANDTPSGGCLTIEEWVQGQWETKDKGIGVWGKSGKVNYDGWDTSRHQNKKVKGSESVLAADYTVLYNPWEEAQPPCRKETGKDTTWGCSSAKGWGNNESWGSVGWENQKLPSKEFSRDRGCKNDSWGSGRWENQEWHSKRYSRVSRQPDSNNPWKAGVLSENAAFREYGPNAGGWQTRRESETEHRNWDVKRSSDSDGWGRQPNKRDDLHGYHSNYKDSWPRRDDYRNRKVNF